jgi:hypothetical protein
MRRSWVPAALAPYRAAFAVALLLAAGPPLVAPAQGKKPEIPIALVATEFLQGRFQMPVTCTRTDGTQVRLQESVVFRPAMNRDGNQTLRMTFFGLSGSDLARCYNTVYPTVPDRRGVLYVSYSSRDKRADTGIKNFVRSIQRGPLEYVITGGRLQIRGVGEAGAEPRVIRFDGRSTPLFVSAVARGSDPDKLLGEAAPLRGRVPRKLSFRIEGPDDFRFENAYLEDSSRFK